MRKTEITIEVARTVTIRQTLGNARTPCPECVDQTDMVSPAEAVKAARIDLRTVYRLIEAGKIHFLEKPSGPLLICLRSLKLALARTGRDQPPEPVDSGINDEPPGPWLDVTEQGVHRITIPPTRQTRPKAPMLTRKSLDDLLAYLDSDRERAGQKYELIRRKLVKFFECRGCRSPEEYADATIDRVALKIADDVSIYSIDPYGFFYGVARNMLKDYWRQSKKQPISLQDMKESIYGSACLASAPDYDADQKTEQQLTYLDQCLRDLSPECREIIKQYYEAPGGTNISNRKQLAARLGIPLSALRIRIHRIKARLKQSISEFLCEGAR